MLRMSDDAPRLDRIDTRLQSLEEGQRPILMALGSVNAQVKNFEGDIPELRDAIEKAEARQEDRANRIEAACNEIRRLVEASQQAKRNRKLTVLVAIGSGTVTVTLALIGILAKILGVDVGK